MLLVSVLIKENLIHTILMRSINCFSRAWMKDIILTTFCISIDIKLI